jgi:AcrR family transcriptional regulator
MNRRLTPRGQDRRRQLMDYAARRFAANGYHPTSVAEIVQGLGVGKGVFYWYFSSKEELFLEILRESQHELRRVQQQAIGDEPEPLRRIEAGIRASMRWLAEHRHVFTLLQFAASDERFSAALRRGQDVALGDVARHVKDGIVAGQVRDSDPMMLAHSILGVTNHMARNFIFLRGDDPDMVAGEAVAFCLGGLRGESPARPGSNQAGSNR